MQLTASEFRAQVNQAFDTGNTDKLFELINPRLNTGISFGTILWNISVEREINQPADYLLREGIVSLEQEF